jgi:phosphoglycerol transferase MdoB-like AlkP superfamily enzyme
MKIQSVWKYIKAEPAFSFLYNFLFMMVIFSICRIFFFLVNKSYFTDVDFTHFLTLLKGGIQFDLTALLYTNLLYMVMQFIPFKFRYNKTYQQLAKWVFMITNSLVIIINCMDIPFFRFTNRRTTSTIFSEFENENNLLKIIFEGIFNYWYITLFTVCIIIFLYKLYYTPRERKESHKISLKSSILYYLSQALILIVITYFTVIGIRGGFGAFTRPITLSNANKYVNKSNETAIVLNTPFCLLRTIDKKIYKDPRYFNDEVEMDAIYSPVHNPKPAGEFKQMNVVIIIWESLGKEYTGFFNHDLDNGSYNGFTPFMDSLLTEGLTFNYSYSNGRKSIDAMPSILSSIPMFIEPYIVTPYSTNDISSIAAVLKEKGYYSAFFHGAPNGSMGFQAYAKSAGFDDYFGMDECPDKAFDGTWAIWDEEFLQFYADKMGELKQPFITSVFTASSHHPFAIPKKYEGQFPEGTLPIHKCIGYSDYSIRRFFKKMSQYDWFANTLFVITADHANESNHQEYLTDLGVYAVPILFYHPGSNLKGLVDSIPVNQIDIMPSILSYLNYDEPYVAFGQDFFTTKSTDKFAVNYNNQIYQFLEKEYFMQFDGEKVKSVYDYKTDNLLQHNLVGQIEEQDNMEKQLKSIIQQYILRMTENRLLIDK